MKNIFRLILIVTFISCQDEPKESKEIVKRENKVSDDNPELESTKFDTIHLDYSKHSALLTTLTIVPDSAMSSWEWLKHQRIKFMKSFQYNGFFVDSTPNFNDIIEITPNRLKTQVVDGTWTLAIYKTDQNKKIIITNDIVSGGNEIMAFYSEEEKLRPTKFEKLVPELHKSFIRQNDTTCNKILLENNPFTFANYDFEVNEIIVKISYYGDYNDCLKSKTRKFLFNSEKGIFEARKN
jgi:hypothetical protein